MMDLSENPIPNQDMVVFVDGLASHHPDTGKNNMDCVVASEHDTHLGWPMTLAHSGNTVASSCSQASPLHINTLIKYLFDAILLPKWVVFVNVIHTNSSGPFSLGNARAEPAAKLLAINGSPCVLALPLINPSLDNRNPRFLSLQDTQQQTSKKDADL